MSERSKLRKQLIGDVVSSAMDKTVVVQVERRFPHPKYNKYVKKTKKYYAHDSMNKCSVGDSIIIEESKPISKLKRWVVKELIKEAKKI